MSWSSFQRNVQVGFSFPSNDEKCKTTINVPLEGFGDFKYPLNKIKGNTGEIGIWMFEITAMKSKVNNLNGRVCFIDKSKYKKL